MTPNKEDYKAIKVHKNTYESLQELKKVIVQNGLKSLSNDVIDYIPHNCPECGIEMDSIELQLGYYNCPNSKCNFKYPKIVIGLGGSIALGTLIGLGIAGLIYLLTRKDK